MRCSKLCRLSSLIACALLWLGSSLQAQPFERALILGGGGATFGKLVGILDALRRQGQSPDIIIATCGGALSAAMAHEFPETHDMIEYAKSSELHHFLKSIRFKQSRICSRLGVAFCRTINEWDADRIPDLTSTYLLDVPNQLALPTLNRPFSRRKLPIVIVGSQLLFDPEDEREVGTQRGNRKLFRETFFTDPRTAIYLRNFVSPTATQFPRSAVSARTQIITHFTLTQAIRVSISDGLLMRPAEYGGEHFMGGQIDLHPLELAHHLAREVISMYPAPQDLLGEASFHVIYDFDFRLRSERVGMQFANRWIDHTDSGRADDPSSVLAKKAEIEPYLSFFKWGLVSGIPDRLEDFQQKVLWQMSVGRFRASEAVALPENTQSHIRKPGRSTEYLQVRSELFDVQPYAE